MSSSNPVLELLTKAQDLIRDPKNWTQGTYARTKDGTAIQSLDGRAVCFCSLGAINRASTRISSNTTVTAKHILSRAARELTGENRGAAYFNDNETHKKVMAMWDRAKELAA